MIALTRGRLSLLLPVVLLGALLVGACATPATPALPITAEPAPTYAVMERTFQLAINPAKSELYPQESVIVSAIPLGSEQSLSDLKWDLAPGPGEVQTYGGLTPAGGSAVVYTAPDAAPASVYLVAKREETGEIDQILFTVVAPLPAANFVLTSYGGFWSDARARDALLGGLPVKDLLAAAFPNRPAQLAADFPGQWLPDASVVPYDPEQTKKLAEETTAAGSKLAVVFVTPQGDSETLDLAKRMADQLWALGIEAEIREAPEVKTVLETMTAAGEPALGLWR